MFPADALGPALAPASYDLVLYAVGPKRDAAYRLARTYPGVLWLHDLGLADRELVADAHGVIVGSEPARALLEQDLGPEFGDTPTWVIRTAVSDASAGEGGRGTDRPWSFEEVARHVVDIAALDLEPARPQPASAPASVSAPLG
jgi:hypothetical protein